VWLFNENKSKGSCILMGNDSSKNKRDQFIDGKRRGSKAIYLLGGIVIILAALAVGIYYQHLGSPTIDKPDPREAKYIGRYLPKGYEAAKLIEPVKYEKRIDPVDIVPVVKDGQIQIAVGDIIKNRIVYFEYTRLSDKRVVPMMAYIRPSGKLFTGVSLCPPCQAKRQYIDKDGLLTCTACGTKRDPETQIGISGACKLYPLDELPHKLLGDKISNAEDSLDAWKDQLIDRPTE
jgi:hypothetical protein